MSTPKSLTVKVLKEKLTEAGLSTEGLKAALVARLAEHQEVRSARTAAVIGGVQGSPPNVHRISDRIPW